VSPGALAEFVAEFQISTETASAPAGIAVDASGTVYVVDSKQDLIRVFDDEGNPVATWGESGDGPGQFKFSCPCGSWGDIAIGPDGNFYVVDPFNNRVQVLGPDGTFLREWGEEGSEEGQFNLPAGLATDDSGHVYVTDGRNARLQIFDSDGQFLAAWAPTEEEGGPLLDPEDVAVDAAGNVWVTDYETNRVYHFDPEGNLIDSFGGMGIKPGQFTRPWGAATDALGTSTLPITTDIGCRSCHRRAICSGQLAVLAPNPVSFSLPSTSRSAPKASCT
jgi:DNA-binding beta-propeller fold protein YncE